VKGDDTTIDSALGVAILSGGETAMSDEPHWRVDADTDFGPTGRLSDPEEEESQSRRPARASARFLLSALARAARWRSAEPRGFIPPPGDGAMIRFSAALDHKANGKHDSVRSGAGASRGARLSPERELQRLFQETTMGHVDELYGTAMRLTRNDRDAEDLVQDTYMRAFRAFHQFEPGTNCRAWLFKILTNTFINGYRRRVKERDILQKQEHGVIESSLYCRESMDRFSSPETRIQDSTFCDDVKAALEAVPVDFRTAVILSDVDGLSFKEIADIMGTPVGTVMSRLFCGRRLLRKALWRFGLDEGYIRAVPADALENAA